MNAIRLVPVILSALALGLHFLRTGVFSFVVAASSMPVILLIRSRWAARLVQIFLFFGVLEWVFTLLLLIAKRRVAGESWTGAAAILGGVALFTLASAFIFSFSRAIRERYGLGSRPVSEEGK